ncbi:MAG: fasciclin domain-containing protein [Myxococcota bacterium]
MCSETGGLTAGITNTLRCADTLGEEERRWDFYDITVEEGDCVHIFADNVNPAGMGDADLAALFIQDGVIIYGAAADFSELDDESACTNEPWSEFACPEASVFAPTSGTVTIGLAQWGGGCTDNAPYTLYIAVNGEDVDLSAGPTNDDAFVGDLGLLGTIPEVLEDDGRFNVLLQAATVAGLAGTLSEPGPLTVFAPTDDAFNALLVAEGIDADTLLADPNLADILSYHVVLGRTLASDLSDNQVITTALGQNFRISITNEGVFINGVVQIIETDIPASNGVIHVIDAVLSPPGDARLCSETGNLTAGITDTLRCSDTLGEEERRWDFYDITVEQGDCIHIFADNVNPAGMGDADLAAVLIQNGAIIYGQDLVTFAELDDEALCTNLTWSGFECPDASVFAPARQRSPGLGHR